MAAAARGLSPGYPRRPAPALAALAARWGLPAVARRACRLRRRPPSRAPALAAARRKSVAAAARGLSPGYPRRPAPALAALAARWGATRPACSFFGRFGALFYTSTIPPRIRAR